MANDVMYLMEAGVNVDRGYYAFLDEATKIQVTDQVMTEMFKFITDKYNSIDFSEIEKSAGDYKRFKYNQLIESNLQVLENVYRNSTQDGADKFLDTVKQMHELIEFLTTHREEFSYLYKNKVGIAQLIYTSMVSSIVYAVSALIAQTIRFITLEDDDDLSVVYDEMNNAAKNIHVKNIQHAVNSLDAIEKYLSTVYRDKKNRLATNESITWASIVAGISSPVGIAVAAIGATILLLPRIIPFIREVIYSIYYSRVNFAQAIGVQIELIRTNIESLETSGRGTKKIIAKQKNIVRRLEKLQNIVAVRTIDAQSMTSRKIKEENRSLNIDRNSALASNGTDGLLI